MTRDTEDQAARVGAIDVALSENNVQKATTLASGLQRQLTGTYAVAGASGGGKKATTSRR